MSHTELPLVTFVSRAVARHWRDIDQLGVPDSFPSRIRSGVDVWVISTFLELRACAERLPFRVALSDTFPEQGAALAHSDDLRWQKRYWRSFVAGVRGDRPRICSTPWQIVQNPLQETDRAVFIPSWPQPGLIPRDCSRQGISVLGYFGRSACLPSFFSDPEFRSELTRRGVGFFVSDGWQDYSATDVCVGMRNSPSIVLDTKPYAKLVNAWLAGVPALLGPEPAYRALHRSPLDYIEVSSARDVLDALMFLRANPASYAAMVENGRKRCRSFARHTVADRWIDFLAERFLPSWRTSTKQSAFGVAKVLIAHWAEKRRYKRTERLQLRSLAAHDSAGPEVRQHAGDAFDRDVPGAWHASDRTG